MTDGLTEKDRAGIRAALEACPKVRRAVLFGSRAMGTFRGASDVDLALEGDNITLADLLFLTAKIDALDLPVDVDLVIRDTINSHELEQHIKEYGQEWYRKSAGIELAVDPFGEVLSLPLRNGLTRPRSVRGEGVPMVNMGELFAHSRIRDVEMDRVPLSEAEEASYLLEPGDLLFARQSLVLSGAGKCSIFLDAKEPTTFEGHLIRARIDRSKGDPLFYYYFFQSHLGRQAIESIVEQVAAAGIRGSDLSRLLVPRHPAKAQRAIAHILGTLDDKIELNRRMNETLESIARAIFKSWFVDFDPVHAKAGGRDPGLPKHIADLFPDSFEDSELGEIPEGWEARGLDEIARFLNGLALQKHPPRGDRSLPAIKIAQLRAGNTEGADKASADLGPDYVVDDGDVIFSWSGSLECALWAGGPGALNQHLFRVTSAAYPKWFYYLWVHEHLDSFRQIAAGKATTMGHIQRHHLSDAKVIIPDEDLLAAANGVLSPMIDRITQCCVESRTLAALRDALLPKLISGELRISDAEQIVERTA